MVAIKATLYRTSSDSPIIAALLKAADNGKQVAGTRASNLQFTELPSATSAASRSLGSVRHTCSLPNSLSSDV